MVGDQGIRLVPTKDRVHFYQMLEDTVVTSENLWICTSIFGTAFVYLDPKLNMQNLSQKTCYQVLSSYGSLFFTVKSRRIFIMYTVKPLKQRMCWGQYKFSCCIPCRGYVLFSEVQHV